MYGIFISSAILICTLIAERIHTDHKIDKNTFWGAVTWAIIGGVLGARLYHVLDLWEYYLSDPIRIVAVWQGGLGIIGGVVGGAIGLTLYLRYKKEQVIPWLDTSARVIPLGQAIGRLGNIYNEELIPYAYYEIPFNLGLFVLLNFLPPSIRNNGGRLFITYLFSYAIIRITLSPLR